MNRRYFLRSAAGGAAGMAGLLAVGRYAWVSGRSPKGISKFSATLPGLGPDGANNLGNFIPVLSPDTKTYPGIDYYDVVAQQFTQTLHPAIGPTRLWGYVDAKNLTSKYLGGVIVATHGRPVKLKVTNSLPPTHILPLDPTAIDPPLVKEVGGRADRITVHLHGAVVAWTSDGGPASWFTNSQNPGGFAHGSSFLNKGPTPGSAMYDYPNNQSARLVWYHDHAYGITRLNAYSGLASAYLITDDAESMMIKSGILPDVPGYPLGIPLIIQDKSFFDPASDATYPVSAAQKGDLWYPHDYPGPPIPKMTLPVQCGATGRWNISGGTPPSVSLVPEAFFDTNLVNGAPYPVLSVSPRRYRFQTLNAAQARFYNLQLYVGDQSADGITLKESADLDNNGNRIRIPTNPAGPKIIQIGKDSGLLPAPVVLNDPPKPIGYLLTTDDDDPRHGNANRYNLLLSPGERADIIVDFRGFEGHTIVLYNDAPAPFPMGDIRNDYYAGAPDLTCIGRMGSTQPGYGPDTRIVMRFDVAKNGSVNEPDFEQTLANLQATLPAVYLQTLPPALETQSPPKIKTLNEGFDSNGRLMQMLGSPHSSGYLSKPIDVASKGETQTWQVYNLTGDTHPIHWHLVNVQVVKREAWQFDSEGHPVLPLRPIPGTARPPDPNEAGWKETLRMDPGEVTTVIMKFDMPFDAPPSPRLQAEYGLKGAEYVWHCHILEHEEHDMMHALVIA
jgi:FtsP/CotA-like multicopper oxidase with cupredoxin domain